MTVETRALALAVDGGVSVPALLLAPLRPQAVFVFAHGAGAGMHHPFMTALAGQLAGRGLATYRYQFPFMEKGTKRPDPPRLARATVRAAAAHAARLLPGVALIAGGKSFGGRMTSQAQAARPLDGVRGIVLVGFPLHPPKQPSTGRAAHLADIGIPMLFLQGTRDELADLGLVQVVAAGLGARATLAVVDDADHAFHVRKRSGRDDAQVIADLAQRIADWSATL